MINDQNSFLQFLQNERDKFISLQHSIDKDIVEKRVMNITQRREYYQHITILSLGLTGVTFFTDKVVNKTFFVLGFIFLVLTVLLVLMWLREVLDKEGKDLATIQDKYNIATEERDSVIEEFAKKSYTTLIISEYYSALNSLPSSVSLQKESLSRSESRKNSDNLPLDYFGEFIIFFFFLGLFFLFMSVCLYKISGLMLGSIILFIFSISFQDFLLTKSVSVSRFISYLHKDIKLFVKK